MGLKKLITEAGIGRFAIPPCFGPSNVTTIFVNPVFQSTKTGNELVSTGLYAIPGKLVTVTVPAELTSAKLSVVIGHHRSVKPTDKTAYISMPDSRRTFAASQTQTKAISPHGGLIMLSVPKEKGLDKVKLTISGAIVAPRYVLGTHNDQQWKTIRNAPAPWGELISDKLVMIVDSEALRQLDNPTDLMTWWDKAVADHEGFYNYDRGFPFRMHMMNHARMGVSYWPLEWSKKSTLNILCYRKFAAYNDGLLWLRAARFGQVVTTNNDQWSHVYWQDAKDQCALRFGCFTAADKPATRKEKFGFAMLDTGLYQFGDVSVRVGKNNISAADVSVVSGADLKNAIKNRWTN